MNDLEKTIPSPCVSICVLNEEDICVGCHRSAKEITHWGTYNNKERLEVLHRSIERSRKNNPFL